MRRPSPATRLLGIGLLVIAVGLVGVALGRATVPSCANVRDAHGEVAGDIAAGARTDPVMIDAGPVVEAHDLLQGRPDCFSTGERQEVRALYRRYGAGG